MRRISIALLSLGLIATASSTSSAATTAVASFNSNYTSVNTFTNPPQTLGFDFMAKSAIIVNALGVFDASGNITPGQTVYLSDVTGGGNTVIATENIAGPYNAGNFSYGTSTLSVQLTVGHIYSIYSVFVGDAYGSSPSAPAITLSTDLINVTPTGASNGNNGLYNNNGTLVPPSSSYALIATDFIYSPAVVPEPASLGMMGLGLAGVALLRRKITKRSA